MLEKPTASLLNKRRLRPILTYVLVLGLLPSHLIAGSSLGVNILLDRTSGNGEKLIYGSARPLFSQNDQEAFMTELEQTPPDWDMLHDHPGEEQGHRLFQFNRNRDKKRAGHPLLQQRVAFYWSGILRQYVDELKGFRVAIGPIHTQTSWGIVRFKPVNIPSEMVAIPTHKEMSDDLQERLTKGSEIDVVILLTGRLVPDESLMYAFSHENSHQGMVLPFVRIDNIQYILQ
ncbi:MAG: hypothetical protein MRJ96_15400 [Nitrospirales bacterium]|nr:hypothetical protein [Nitrospira sp.]MDR4502829.1 hypothetical protein [Nitrospirales bacterium]